jgi:hypothetical protein
MRVHGEQLRQSRPGNFECSRARPADDWWSADLGIVALCAVLWETYCKQYGPTGDALTLVAHGASKVFNPTLPQRIIDRALEKDRAKATAEYLAEFRTDLEGFVALEVVEACVGDYREQQPAADNSYSSTSTVRSRAWLIVRIAAFSFCPTSRLMRYVTKCLVWSHGGDCRRCIRSLSS